MKIKHNDRDNGFEIFEYEPRWREEFLSSRIVDEWCDDCPEQFSRKPSARKPGTATYFSQYALMFLLWREYSIRSITWLQIGAVNRKARALAVTAGWIPAIPTGGVRSQPQTQSHWATMRKQMGPKFESLQQAIVRAEPRFKPGHQGEPDLFCYTADGRWFFAEAKTDGEEILSSQTRWFGIAEDVLGPEGRVFKCRVFEKGNPRAASQPKHSARWERMNATRGAAEQSRPRPVVLQKPKR